MRAIEPRPTGQGQAQGLQAHTKQDLVRQSPGANKKSRVVILTNFQLPCDQQPEQKRFCSSQMYASRPDNGMLLERPKLYEDDESDKRTPDGLCRPYAFAGCVVGKTIQTRNAV